MPIQAGDARSAPIAGHASAIGAAPHFETPYFEASLDQTPLHDWHVRQGAKMVAFAGYSMPVQYPTGLLKEHRHTRTAAGLFDVSHMGQIELSSRHGDFADVALALERLIPIDILGLAVGRQKYGFVTDEAGGILDDLMVANLGDRLLLVVNAGCKGADEALLRAKLPDTCSIDVMRRGLIAVQGPGAEAALARLAPEAAAMRFMNVRALSIIGLACIVSRSGYTGEDGYEIAVPETGVEALADRLIEDGAVLPIGLGARDSLRLEAGLCLSGSDIDATTNPVEAGLAWAIGPARRAGGARAGGFPGASIILSALADGPARKRVGLRPEGRAPVRGGASLHADETSSAAIGAITSGGFGPTLEAPVAMGYVPAALAATGTRVFADLRGTRVPAIVTSLPFVRSGFKRH